MNLPLVDSRGCTSCDLHANIKSPGLQTRPWDGGLKGHRKCVILMGKAPGVEEDEAGTPFVGPTGIHTNNTYVKGSGLAEVCDVFLTNAVRCKMPNPKMAVPGGCIKACSSHLMGDLAALDAAYDEVVFLCTGNEAVQSICGGGYSLGHFPQGAKFPVGGRDRVVFATYNAAILLERADPAKLSSIERHFMLLVAYMRDGHLSVDVDVTPEGVDRTSRLPDGVKEVSLDIETYGKLTKYPAQRFFHPQKSIHWDRVAPHELVCTAGLAWRDPCGRLRHRHYVLCSARERDEFYDDLSKVARPDCSVIGANLLFDIMYLRQDSDAAKLIFEPFGVNSPRLIDVLVLSFLDDDTRPEKGLKGITKLLRTVDYSTEETSKKEYLRHDSPFDLELGAYQIRDVYATLLAKEKLMSGYQVKYGPGTAKGTDYSMRWYSDLMWLVLRMSERGIRYDRTALEEVTRTLEGRILRWERAALTRYGTALRREGAGPEVTDWLKLVDLLTSEPCKSEKAQARRVAKADALRTTHNFQEGWPLYTPQEYLKEVILRVIRNNNLDGDKRIKLTEVDRSISLGSENINLCLGYATGTDRKFLRTWTRFHSTNKLLGTYLRPLLGWKPDPTKSDINKALVGDMAYPTWRLVPSSDESGEEGGTQQGRVTAKGPAVQTAPPVVEQCEVSRYPGGAMLYKDERQIELRVPIMYSREEHMRDLFASGGTPYERAAEVAVGYPVRKKSHPNEYLLGKTLMLAVQFRAKAPKLQETARRDLNVDKPLPFWEGLISSVFSDRAGLIATQDEWIARVKRDGFIEVPLVGISRTFLGTSTIVDKTYIPTIVNIPIQALAAVITLDAQIAAEKWLIAGGYRTGITKNTYDEGAYDCPPDEVEVVSEALSQFYRNPPILKDLYALGLYEVPLDCSTVVRYNPSGLPPYSSPTGGFRAE